MTEPPDETFSSESITISGGISLEDVSDWESIGLGSHLNEDGQLVLNTAGIDLELTPEHWKPPLSVDLSVDILFENDDDSEAETETTTVELLNESGEVLSSDTVESLTLSPGEERTETVRLHTEESGWLNIEASAGGIIDDIWIESTTDNFELSTAYPETITAEEGFNFTTTVHNDRSFSMQEGTLTVGLNTGTENITGRFTTVPELDAFSEYEFTRFVSSDDLDVGEQTMTVEFSSPHMEDELVTVESFEVIAPEGVDLDVDLNVDDRDLDGIEPPQLTLRGGFEIENIGGEDATDVSTELTLYREGEPLDMMSNTWSTGSIKPGGSFQESFSSTFVTFEERGEHTAELVIDVDELDEPVVGEDTMHLVDEPGEPRLNVDLIGVEEGSVSEEYQFEVVVEEESKDPAEDLVVETVLRDSNDVVVFEQTDDLPDLELESETLSYTVGELSAGGFDIEVTADAENVTESVSESFEVIDEDALELDITVAAEDVEYGNETEVTVTLENQMDQDATSVVADVIYYEQDGNQFKEPETFSVETISVEGSETVEDDQLIAECWQVEMNCIPGASTDTGEYTVEVSVELDQANEVITEDANFQVW